MKQSKLEISSLLPFSARSSLVCTLACLLLAACGANQQTSSGADSSQGGCPTTCDDTHTCIDGVCQPTASVCGGMVCSGDNKRCLNDMCVDVESDICVKNNIKCPNENYRCELGECIPTCAKTSLCGGKCCANSETCFDHECITPPTKQDPGSEYLCQTTRGADPTWCPMGEGCFTTADADAAQVCLPIGNKCDEEKEQFCKIRDYCDPTYDRCVELDLDRVCFYKPEINLKDPPEEYFKWTAGKHAAQYDQVMASPVVVNFIDNSGDGKLDLKDTPEIVFTTFKKHMYAYPGVLRVIRGIPDENGNAIELWDSASIEEPFWSYSSATPAIADLNKDGIPEVIIGGYGHVGNFNIENPPSADVGNRKLFARRADGSVFWTKDINPDGKHSGVLVADLDADETPEILAGWYVLDGATGDILCDTRNSELTGNNNMPVTAVDLDNDGRLELVSSSSIIKFTEKRTCKIASALARRSGSHVAVADLTGDGNAELITVSGGKLIIEKVDPKTLTRHTYKETQLDIDEERAMNAGYDCTTAAGRNNKHCHPGGGQPIVAYFSGGEHPEIGVAGRWYYFVFNSDGSLRWKKSTQDVSSAATSSSVFDFNGDGKAEVVYNDELHLMIYDGNTGDELLKIDNHTGTLEEYPVIADVNNDGRANIVVCANNYGRGGVPEHGIRVFKEKNNNWVPTRNIWNQFAYFVTNINKDATVPSPQLQNWKQPWLNNYLQNVQKGNPWLAPNLTPMIRAISDVKGDNACTARAMDKHIAFDIRNIGARDVNPGQAPYKVIAKAGSETIEVKVGVNTDIIKPGKSEPFDFDWTIPDGWEGQKITLEVVVNEAKTVKECEDKDNSAHAENVAAAAPNYAVTIDNVELIGCLQGTATIQYTISNNSTVEAPAGAKVSIKAGPKGAPKEIGTQTIDQAIQPGASVTQTYEWNDTNLPKNIMLEFKVEVDSDMKHVECNEDDNAVSLNNICSQFL